VKLISIIFFQRLRYGFENNGNVIFSKCLEGSGRIYLPYSFACLSFSKFFSLWCGVFQYLYNCSSPLHSTFKGTVYSWIKPRMRCLAREQDSRNLIKSKKCAYSKINIMIKHLLRPARNQYATVLDRFGLILRKCTNRIHIRTDSTSTGFWKSTEREEFSERECRGINSRQCSETLFFCSILSKILSKFI
jgi:hypothetical protein